MPCCELTFTLGVGRHPVPLFTEETESGHQIELQPWPWSPTPRVALGRRVGPSKLNYKMREAHLSIQWGRIITKTSGALQIPAIRVMRPGLVLLPPLGWA